MSSLYSSPPLSPYSTTSITATTTFPVIVRDLGGGPATLKGMGIKTRTKTIENQFGLLQTITLNQHDSFIIGCYNFVQQQKVKNAKSIARIPVECRIPTPWMEGVVYGISGIGKLKICQKQIWMRRVVTQKTIL